MLKKVPNEADNIAIFQSCLLPKMRLTVVLEGRNTGYKVVYILWLLLAFDISFIQKQTVYE